MHNLEYSHRVEHLLPCYISIIYLLIQSFIHLFTQSILSGMLNVSYLIQTVQALHETLNSIDKHLGEYQHFYKSFLHYPSLL